MIINEAIISREALNLTISLNNKNYFMQILIFSLAFSSQTVFQNITISHCIVITTLSFVLFKMLFLDHFYMHFTIKCLFLLLISFCLSIWSGQKLFFELSSFEELAHQRHPPFQWFDIQFLSLIHSQIFHIATYIIFCLKYIKAV